jgi:hypothetical protein
MRAARNLERNRRFTDKFKARAKLWLPIHSVRLAERRQQELEAFDDMCSSGVSFTPEERLPPWKRQAAMLEATQVKKPVPPRLKLAGVRLRIAEPGAGQSDGFPTHFQ